jgi:hypothetical protein
MKLIETLVVDKSLTTSWNFFTDNLFSNSLEALLIKSYNPFLRLKITNFIVKLITFKKCFIFVNNQVIKFSNNVLLIVVSGTLSTNEIVRNSFVYIFNRYSLHYSINNVCILHFLYMYRHCLHMTFIIICSPSFFIKYFIVFMHLFIKVN